MMVLTDDLDTLPAAPERFTTPLRGGAIAGWRWANCQRPPLLFCHATGFCASAYKQMLGQLRDDFDIYAIDMRGHGRTTLNANASTLRSWKIYADDICGFLDAHPRPNWTLAGHSMGGVTAALAAGGRKDIVALRLLEPVAMPAFVTFAAATPLWRYIKGAIPLVRGAARRRAQWPDRAAASTAYGRKALFKSWAAGGLDDYLEDGLIEDGVAVALACAPVWEAATFAAHAHDFWGAVRAAPSPVSVLAAGRQSSTVSALARRRFARYSAAVSLIKDAGHLVPMERPDLAANFVARAPQSAAD